MYMVREILHCKPGKVGEMVEKFKGLSGVMERMGIGPFRLYTDVSGEDFWTMVAEHDYESFEDIPAVEAKVMADDEARSIMAGYHDLIIRGRREIYKVEA